MRSWALIVRLISGVPVLAIMGPIGVLKRNADIVFWLTDQRKGIADRSYLLQLTASADAGSAVGLGIHPQI